MGPRAGEEVEKIGPFLAEKGRFLECMAFGKRIPKTNNEC